MPSAARYLMASFAGAALGYVCMVIFANLEDWQFYTIRKLITGKTAPSQIVAHPADRWVVPILFSLFVYSGAFFGAFLVWLRRSN